MLHLHQVAEGDGLQGEPEEVPLARPQQVERPKGEEGEGSEEQFRNIYNFVIIESVCSYLYTLTTAL